MVLLYFIMIRKSTVNLNYANRGKSESMVSMLYSEALNFTRFVTAKTNSRLLYYNCFKPVIKAG